MREPGDGDLRAPHLFARLVAAGELRLRRAVHAVDLEAGERDGPRLVGDVDEPEERRGASSVTTRTRRPRSGNGIGRVVCVGAGNGGLQSSPETSRGVAGSSMSRMTKPPCQ